MRRLLEILVPVLLAVAGGPMVCAAQQRDPREAELAQIRREIASLQERLSETASRESGLEADVERTRLELRLQEQKLAEATAAAALAAERATDARGRIAELEAALDAVRDDLKRRLSGLYRLGRQGYLRLFLALRPDQQLLPSIRQLRYLARRDRQTLETFRATRDELERERRRRDAEELAMAEWRERETERRRSLVRLRHRQELLLERVARERRVLEAKAGRLRDKERKLARLIASLLGDGAGPLSGTPIHEFRGALDWPVRGEVTGRFGPRRDPRYKTEVPHNGIDIVPGETAPGDVTREIHAVFPGAVLFAAPFEGYGLMVVIHHPGRVFTLYSGLGELSVAKGDVVSLGETVGTAAGQLYFEIRRDNQPEDPLLWLR